MTETYNVVNIGRALAGLSASCAQGRGALPLRAARLGAGLPARGSIETPRHAALENVEGHSARGARSLALRYRGTRARPRRPRRHATFIPPEALDMAATPVGLADALPRTDGTGQSCRRRRQRRAGRLPALLSAAYDANDELATKLGPETSSEPRRRP